METQSLIELRRLDAIEPASDVTAHGDYTVVLKEPMVLHEGDSVVLNRSFIDTRAQLGNTIDLPEGVKVTGKYIIWMQNWFPALGQATPYLQYNSVPYGQAIVNNKFVKRPLGFGPFNSPGNFVLCNEPDLVQTGQKQVFALVATFLVDVNTPRYVKLIYSSNPNDNTELTGYFYIFVGKHSKTDDVIFPCNVLLGGMDKNQSWLRTDPTDNPPFKLTDLDGAGFDENDFFLQALAPSGKAATLQAFTPREFAFDFEIVPGKYTPAALAQRITGLMTADQKQLISTRLLGSSFVQTPKAQPFVQVWPSGDVPVISNGVKNGETITIDPYGINFVSVTTDHPIYVGASETALEFDNDSNTFRFTFLHTPILDPSDAPSTYQVEYDGYDPQGTQTPQQRWLATAHSGIAFTELEPKSFWEGALGFDESSLLVDITKLRQAKDVGGAISNIQTPLLNLTPGKNITTSFEGSASLLVNSGGKVNFYDASVPRAEYVATNLTTPILAGALPPTTTDTSHYLVEVSGVPMSQMVTSKTQTFNLAGVVGRYQTRGSFTQGAGGDGTPTTVRGASVVISKLHVRILNPDRTPVTDMGADSVVFLNLARQARLPPPLPPLLAAQPPGELPAPPVPGETAPPQKKTKLEK